MSGNRHNGGIIGPKNITSSASASGVWDTTAARQLSPWPSTDLPTTGLLANWDFSNAFALFDATTGGSNVAADGAIARVEDQSVNGWDLVQSTLANRPLRKTGIINGLDAGYWGGGGDGLAYTSFSSAGSVYILYVFSTSDVDHIFFNSSANGGGAFTLAAETGTGVPLSQVSFSDLKLDGASFAPTTRLEVSNAFLGTHCVSVKYNFANAWSSFSIGNWGSNFDYIGYIGEILIYDESVGASVIYAEEYLKKKWGIT